MLWYYAKGDQPRGPVEDAELRDMALQGRLGPEDLVWNESMGTQWRPAGEVEGLFGGGVAAPPVPEAPQAPVQGTRISCLAPVGVAWQAMVDRLFRPFSISKWFALGVSAWMASIWQRGWGGGFKWTGNLDFQGMPEVFGDV